MTINKRREFLKKTTSAALGVTIIPRYVIGKGFIPPSDRFNIGVIGLGAQSSGLIERMSKISDARVIAGCDIHKKRLNRFSKLVDNEYVKHKIKGRALIYEDFYKLIENNNTIFFESLNQVY